MSIHQARVLRKSMSPPEVKLWHHLRTRPNGLIFRRQHPYGPFVLDFFCRSAGLAVEIDGFAHEGDGPQDRDRRRNAWVADHGIRTLRIRAVDVQQDFEAVVKRVIEAAMSRTPPPPSAVPLPAEARGGELA